LKKKTISESEGRACDSYLETGRKEERGDIFSYLKRGGKKKTSRDKEEERTSIKTREERIP